MKIVLLFILSLSISAKPCLKTPSKGIDLSLWQSIQGAVRKVVSIDHWAASSDNIKNAPCKGKVPNLKEMKEYNNSLEKSEKSPGITTINGAEFENESKEMIYIFDMLAKHRKYSGTNFPEEKQPDYSHLTKGDCKKARCALKSLLGEEYAENAIYLLSKYELNISPVNIPKDKNIKFPAEELKSIHQSIVDIPTSFFPIEKNRSLKRSNVERGSTLANATITFFEGFKKYNHHEKAGVCNHEFSHNFSDIGDFDESKEWLALSGWTLEDAPTLADKENKEWKKSNDNFVSEYAMANPGEDFAESMVAYRYNPELFKAVAPKKYSFIKELVYKGREYDGGEGNSCQGLSSYEKFISNEISRVSKTKDFKLEDFLDENSIEEFLNSCKEDSLKYMFEKKLNALKDCSEGAFTKAVVDKMWPNLRDKFEYPEKVYELIVKGHFKFKINGDVSNRDEIIEKANKLIKKKTNDLLREGLRKKAVESNYISTDDKKLKPKDYCKQEFSKYSYQSFEHIKKPFKDDNMAYDNSENFNKLANDLCLSVYLKRGVVKDPISQNEVDNYFASRYEK